LPHESRSRREETAHLKEKREGRKEKSRIVKKAAASQIVRISRPPRHLLG